MRTDARPEHDAFCCVKRGRATLSGAHRSGGLDPWKSSQNTRNSCPIHARLGHSSRYTGSFVRLCHAYPHKQTNNEHNSTDSPRHNRSKSASLVLFVSLSRDCCALRQTAFVFSDLRLITRRPNIRATQPPYCCLFCSSLGRPLCLPGNLGIDQCYTYKSCTHTKKDKKAATTTTHAH